MDARLICVIGGGIGGLVFAALHRANGGEILVLERENIAASADKDDGKSVVINAASAALLRKTGADLAAAAPLSKIRVHFQGAPGGATIDGGVIGFGIAHREARRRLAEILRDSLRAPAEVTAIAPQAGAGARVCYRAADGEEQTANAAAIVIACASPLLPPFFSMRALDYRQAIISFTAAARNFPREFALESFTRIGIVALVPRADKKIGIIICAESGAAAALLTLSDDELLQKINDCCGGEFGLHSAGARFVYAPQARRTSPLSAGKIALLGAGATILHPAGAQGLNLGIADAECLAELLRRGGEIESILAAYRRRRAPAHIAAAAATSILAAGGHLRAPPFRMLGGALAAAAFPFRKSIAALLSGARRPQKAE